MTQWWTRLTSNDTVFGTTEGVGRVFLGCTVCGRVLPAWRLLFTPTRTDRVGCRCGNLYSRPIVLPEWKAAWWVLVVGWLWRKTIRQEAQWDPRLPARQS